MLEFEVLNFREPMTAFSLTWQLVLIPSMLQPFVELCGFRWLIPKVVITAINKHKPEKGYQPLNKKENRRLNGENLGLSRKKQKKLGGKKMKKEKAMPSISSSSLPLSLLFLLCQGDTGVNSDSLAIEVALQEVNGTMEVF